MDLEIYYAAMKIDIVNSRNYKDKDRAELQEKFIKITQEDANIIFGKNIKSLFVVTHGDEIQVLLDVNEQVVDVINYFFDVMQPIKVRFGIGIGTLSTPLREIAIGMDGPAFHLAKDALDIAHNDKKQVVVKIQDINNWDADFYARIINTIFDIMNTIREEWNEVQQEIISFIRKGYVQETIANRLQISQPAVSQNLKRAKWKTYLEAEDTLKQIFKNLELFLEGQRNINISK